ncbi:MAG: helix-turn-helix transcriptional regulator [Deltaproteobacteria bacterium]|nr:helix-turn-helix transcriptional regulator [Deltaproteobacteria bacterium]
MSDLRKYIAKRKARDPEFAKNYESGYQEFKIGVMFKMAREEAGLTQEQLAEKLHTKKQQFPASYQHQIQTQISTNLPVKAYFFISLPYAP